MQIYVAREHWNICAILNAITTIIGSFKILKGSQVQLSGVTSRMRPPDDVCKLVNAACRLLQHEDENMMETGHVKDLIAVALQCLVIYLRMKL